MINCKYVSDNLALLEIDNQFTLVDIICSAV